MDERTPTDGQPYYCIVCGMGWNEYGACEEIDCQLESEERALSRLILNLPPAPTPKIGDYSGILRKKMIMHQGSVPGKFTSEETKSVLTCSCGAANAVLYRTWESYCGGYEDIYYKCKTCKKTWWVEGSDS